MKAEMLLELFRQQKSYLSITMRDVYTFFNECRELVANKTPMQLVPLLEDYCLSTGSYDDIEL